MPKQLRYIILRKYNGSLFQSEMSTKLLNIFGSLSIGLASETISDEAKSLSLLVSYAYIYLTIYRDLSSLIKLYVLATIQIKDLSTSMFTPYESRLPLNTAAQIFSLWDLSPKQLPLTFYAY